MTLMTAMTMNCKGSLNRVGHSPEMGHVRWARSLGSTRLSTCDAGPRPEPPASPRLFWRFPSHPPPVHLRHKAGSQSACNTLDHFLRLLRFMRAPTRRLAAHSALRLWGTLNPTCPYPKS